eukprot:TRINITY_DN10870_c0_g2_i3.p1 TRINITY_DN10870_c0_g2~~TRINITY_DN10870_c0_g2_i3.p1  ORF type:complete len:811 (+),score=108.65 TRINITY_DN10870_c0_g2_i3:124-2556(+)
MQIPPEQILFETASDRVKGLSFHPKQPWILCSLINGNIDLYDYQSGSLLHNFGQCSGPVRSVHFHSSLPLFASGCDDKLIKVWDYDKRICLFTLEGHLDRIRTVRFHESLPWILSAADDQTIRIWNWISRKCIYVVTGHNHYVMCAEFHPTKNLIVSASLDCTVRVWDYTDLLEKYSGGQGTTAWLTTVVIKFVLEGHTRGVSWVSFHPNAPFIVSGGDDRLVKLWKFTDTKAWEVDSYEGHNNNVSCVMFHPHRDVIFSCSEDHTLRLWDIATGTQIHHFILNDRPWMLTAHPRDNLFVTGNDSGMIAFEVYFKQSDGVSQANRPLFEIQERLNKRFLAFQDVPPFHLLEHLAQYRKAGSNLVGEASFLLCALVFGCQTDCTETANPGIVEVVLDVLKDNTSDPILCRCACFALVKLSARETNRAKISILGGIKAVLSAIEAHITDTELISLAFSVLLRLSEHDDHNKMEIGNIGSKLIVLTIEMHLQHNKIQIEGVSLLWSLGSYASVCDQLARLQSIDAVLSAMRCHSGDAAIQHAGCAVLEVFAARYSNMINQLGGIESVLKAMRVHAQFADVQYNACSVLSTVVAQGSDEDRLDKIIIFEGVQACLTAMTEHIQHREVQVKAFGFLLSLGNGGEKCRTEIVKLGGIKTSLSSLEAHFQDLEIQSVGMTFLADLALDIDNQRKLAVEGVIKHVYKVMQSNLQSREIHFSGVKLVGNLSDIFASRPAPKELITLILSSMRRNLDDGDLLEVACAALANFAANEVAKEMIKSLGGVKAVKTAMGRHPKKLSKTGMRAINALQPGCTSQ